MVKKIILLISISLIFAQPPPNGGQNQNSGTACDKKSKEIKYEFNTSEESVYPGGYLKMTSNNCPGYDWTSQSTPNQAFEIDQLLYIPLKPKISKTLIYPGMLGADGNTNPTPIKGAIGRAINGISIFSNVDAENEDAFVSEGHTFDDCGGHPNDMGEYHYHAEPEPGCVFTDEKGKHSPLFGFMYDGIPIFGSQGDNGEYPTDLDACGGHVDKTYNFYHYHLPKDVSFPYTISCLKGCIFDDNGNNQITKYVKSKNSCDQADIQYDYTNFYDNLELQLSGNWYNLSVIIYFIALFILQ